MELIAANHCPGAVIFVFHAADERYEAGLIFLSFNSFVTSCLVAIIGFSIFVHTGDMRFSPSMLQNKCIQSIHKRVTALYLDTTYAHPRHTFPPQEEAIAAVISIVRDVLVDDVAAAGRQQELSTGCHSRLTPSDRKLMEECCTTLILMCTYVVGKERILTAVGNELGLKVRQGHTLSHEPYFH